MKILLLSLTMVLNCTVGVAAEPSNKKVSSADKQFFIKTKYVLVTMPIVRFENFDQFQDGKSSLEIFPGVRLSKNDVKMIDTADKTQSNVILNRPIRYRGMTIKRNCSFLMSNRTRSGASTVRILERVNCARSEIEIDGVSLTTSFADHMGARKGEFGANFDIILRSQLVTEGGQVLHPGNVIRLTDWTDDAKTNEVELVSETPTDPIVPDDYL